MKRPRLFPCGGGGPFGLLTYPFGPLPYMFQGLLVGIKRLPPNPSGPARPLLGGGMAGLCGKYQFGLGGGPSQNFSSSAKNQFPSVLNHRSFLRLTMILVLQGSCLLLQGLRLGTLVIVAILFQSLLVPEVIF